MKSKSSFKWIVASVLLATLTACAAPAPSAPATSQAPAAPAEATAPASTQEPAATAEAVAQPTTEPTAERAASGGGQVFKVTWLQGCPWVSIPLPDPKDDVVHQYVLQNYGIELNVQFNAECENSKIAAQIAAGDIPDFIQQYWNTSTPILNQLIDQGVVLPVDVDKYPGIKNALSPDAFTFLKRDEKIWGIAPPNDPTHRTLWIRQDWLDKLGLKVPTTPDEALEVAKAFTTGDPDGNGQNDTYGFTSYTNNGNPYFGLTGFLAPFGFAPGSADLMVQDNKAYFPGLSENAKAGLEWLNKAVNEKVIDPAWSTNTEDQFREAVASDRVGMVTYYHYMLNPNFYDVADKLKANSPEAEWVWVDPLTGQAGQYMQVQPYANGIGNAFFVTTQAQSEPGKFEAVMKFLNDAVDTESDLYRIMVWGIEGKTFFTDAAGNIDSWKVDDTTEYLRNYRLFRTGNKEYREGSWKKTQPPEMVEGFTRADGLPVIFSVRGLVPANTAQADFDQFIAESHAKFVAGEQSFDMWDEFVNEALTSFSGQTILDEATTTLQGLGMVQ